MTMICYQDEPGGSHDWTRTALWAQSPPAGLPQVDPSGDGGTAECIAAIETAWNNALLVDGVDYYGLSIVGTDCYVFYDSLLVGAVPVKRDALMAPILARAPA